MTDRITEEIAWALVRAVAQRTRATGTTRSDVLKEPLPISISGADLTVRPDGSWQASHRADRAATALLDLYLPLVLGPDLVIGQIGQSLDGRVATESGHSHYVTGKADVVRLHRVRALVDAVLVGAGTASADDPRLTVRHVVGPDPARVVLDPAGRVDPAGALFTDGAAPTLWLRGGTPPSKLAAHVEVVAPRVGTNGSVAPEHVLTLMRARGWRRILVEGGGITVSAFLEAGALDRLHVTVAPLVIGAGRHGITLPPIATLDEALRPRSRHFTLGDDVLFDLDLGP